MENAETNLKNLKARKRQREREREGGVKGWR